MLQLVHLHIPKSAGSTFNYILKRIYKGQTYEIKSYFTEVVQFDVDKMPQDKSILYGHFDNGLLGQLDKETIVISFLREPLERITSGYYNVLRDNKNPIYGEVSKMSLIDYVNSGILMDTDNGQIRRIIGCYYDVPYGKISDVHLEQALEVISNRNYFVGISECFDKSLMLLRRKIGIKNLFYHFIHKGKNKPEVPDLSDGDIRKIIYLNRYDYILYDLFRKKLLIDFDRTTNYRELIRFRVSNRVYNLSIAPFLAYKKLVYTFLKN